MRLLCTADHPRVRVEHEREIGPDALHDGALLARWYVLHRLRQEVDRARRYERPLAIVIAQPELIAGERLAPEALSAAADAVIAAARESDLVGWMSGGSIVLVMPETSAEAARIAAARLRDEMWLRSRRQGGQKWRFAVIDDLDGVAAAFEREQSVSERAA